MRPRASPGVPRAPREELEDGVFHVFARGNHRQLIYLDDADRRRYLAMLANVVRLYHWRCLAYCLMDNHVHLLLETPDANLGAGMQWLHGRYAESFNARHQLSGHVFQGRYGAVRITTDEQLWVAVRYLALNPVEAQLCQRSDGWPWSSHGALLGSRLPSWLDHSRLLRYFAAAGGDPAERYMEMIASD